MNTQKKGISTYDIVAIALMAAFVFVATYFFKIDLPTIGGKTSIKLGNGICILAALLLGGWRGALSAAIGCTLFDLLDPMQRKLGSPSFVTLLWPVCAVRLHIGTALPVDPSRAMSSQQSSARIAIRQCTLAVRSSVRWHSAHRP